jgi:hypothetical protein
MVNHKLEAEHAARAEKLFAKEDDDAQRVGVATKEVIDAIGENNEYIDEVHFTFGQASYKRTVLQLADSDSSGRFSIPSDVVNK